MGLFPSNFVKVLDENFRPMTRATSPMPSSASKEPSPSPQKQKSMFRKPYQAYAAPMPKAEEPKPQPLKPVSQKVRPPKTTQAPSRQNSYLQNDDREISRRNSYLHSHNQSHSNSPSRQNSFLASDDQFLSRQNSYSGNDDYVPSRQNSFLQNGYNTYQQYPQYSSRAPSPTPVHPDISRQPSVIPSPDGGSSPPPPPPPHRVAYNQPPPRTPSPAPSMNDRYPTISRGQSPIPRSPGGHALTPSPLRDAMEDVMCSLNDMGMGQESEPSNFDPWSPEEFEQVRQNSQRRHGRPQSSIGLGVTNDQDLDSSRQYNDNAHSRAVASEPGMSAGSYVDKMEERLRGMEGEPQYLNRTIGDMGPPPVPLKAQPQYQRPMSSRESQPFSGGRRLQNRRSMFSLGREAIDRTMTTKSTLTINSNGTQSTSTNSTTSTQVTGQSLMSGSSAGGVSATSAGSLARRKGGWGSIRMARPLSAFAAWKDDASTASTSRPQTPLTGISYHSSHGSARPASAMDAAWAGSVNASGNDLGGLTQTRSSLKPKRSGFLKRLVETAKTGAANARNSIAGGQEVPRSPVKNLLPNGVTSLAGGSSAARDMGLGGAVGGNNGHGSSAMDWMAVRRDVNRSNSLSRIERNERIERCQLLDHPVVDSIDLLEEAAEGDEGIDGMPISEPTDFQAVNLQLVDKSARFVTSVPPMTNAISLSQGYVCRPYRSDVQRFRAIFTWVSEKIAWEEDFEGDIDTRRIIQSRRGCSEEIAVLVMEMCQAVGLHAEVVQGYLKPPGELPDLTSDPRANHWWNAVLVDGEWRIMDCSLASPTNPKRPLYSSASNVTAESFYFLTRPLEACYTHISSDPAQQRIVPPIDPTILLALPCAMAPYFRNNLRLTEYSTALLYLDNLELMHLHLDVPVDTELYAEVTARAFARDAEGDLYESGEQIVKRALAQTKWKHGAKRYKIKAALPGDEGQGTLNIYAGRRGLMHSIKDNPHALALSIPMYHTGENPSFEFLTRHPTPHAQRHDLYVAQPQCRRLAANNTYVFSVRQHPSSLGPTTSPNPNGASGVASPGSVVSPSGLISPVPFGRPGSAMSMASSSASGSNPSAMNYFQPHHPGQMAQDGKQQQQQYKPAKLAIQAPGGKILRLSRKIEGGLQDEGGTWETIIK
ncbi:MAG: hypothetical protein LQ340_005681, partial [Diploschistes diacapsis]